MAKVMSPSNKDSCIDDTEETSDRWEEASGDEVGERWRKRETSQADASQATYLDMP
jgi:hypothetical protein